jgi:hypothetical protein
MGSLARLYRFVETEVEVKVKVGREERFIRSAGSFMCESFAVCENNGVHIRDLRERELACTELLHGRDHPVLSRSSSCSR